MTDRSSSKRTTAPPGDAAGPSSERPAPPPEADLELLSLADTLIAIGERLDELIARDSHGSSDTMLIALQRQWEDVCSRAVALPASSQEGRRAKARILLAALEVIAPSTAQREIHETLAESLARDVIG